MVPKCQNLFFSVHGLVAYQIDPRPVPDPLGGLKVWDQKVKIHFFQDMVMLHIKLKRNHGYSNMVEIFCPRTP